METSNVILRVIFDEIRWRKYAKLISLRKDERYGLKTNYWNLIDGLFGK